MIVKTESANPENSTNNKVKIKALIQKAAIYVSQGRAGRIDKRVSGNSLSLYTDSYSSCNTVVIESAERIAMLHVDAYMHTDELDKEVQWVADNNAEFKVYLLAPQNKGSLVARLISKHLSEKYNNCLATYIQTGHEGLEVGFPIEGDLPKNKTQPTNIKFYTKEQLEPEHIVHHPREQEFLIAHKVDQAFMLTRKEKIKKTTCIFDSMCWSVIPENELTPIKCDDSYKKDIIRFKAEDGLTACSEKVKLFFTTVLKKNRLVVIADQETDAREVAKNMQLYYNKFDAREVLRVNMLESIEYWSQAVQEQRKKLTSDDKNLFKKLKTAIDENNPCAAIQQIFENTRTSGWHQGAMMMFSDGQSMPLFQQIAEEFEETFKPLYLFAQSFVTRAQYYVSILNYTNRLTQCAEQEIVAKKYPAACNLLSEALRLRTLCLDKSSVELDSAFHLYGKALFLNGDFQMATQHLSTALELRKANRSKKSKALKNTKDILKDCEQQLATLSQGTEQNIENKSL